jgi:hypothetical protein
MACVVSLHPGSRGEEGGGGQVVAGCSSRLRSVIAGASLLFGRYGGPTLAWYYVNQSHVLRISTYIVY